MFTKKFWLGTLERSVATAAEVVVAYFGVGEIFNAFSANWADAGGIAVGAFVLTILKSLAATLVNNPASPSLVDVDPTVVEVDEGGEPAKPKRGFHSREHPRWTDPNEEYREQFGEDYKG